MSQDRRLPGLVLSPATRTKSWQCSTASSVRGKTILMYSWVINRRGDRCRYIHGNELCFIRGTREKKLDVQRMHTDLANHEISEE